MPDPEALARARRDQREGKSASTQAGEFVREEMDHIREGKHGARSAKQAIAIGLSKARRAGVDLAPPAKGKASPETRRAAARDVGRGRRASKSAGAGAAGGAITAGAKPSPARSRAAEAALQREGSAAASPTALSRQATAAAKKRSAADRSTAAKKAARTKGPAVRAAAARKAAATRAKK